MNDVKKTQAQLIEELAELRQQVGEERQQNQYQSNVSRIRDEIWKMKSSEDIEQVLIGIRDMLQALEVPFTDCSVNMVDSSSDPPSIQVHGMRQREHWFQAKMATPGAELVLQFWHTQEMTYRPDLSMEDPYGETRWFRPDAADAPRCVVDIPFTHGTLAVNSIQPHAFSSEDIQFLQEIGQVLSEGFQRWEDFRALEQRKQELENKDRLLAAFHQIWLLA